MTGPFLSMGRRRLERKLVWLIGSPRSGSTWLYRLLCSPPTVVGIHEPLIGAHLGLLASATADVPTVRFSDRPRLVDLRGEDDEYFFSRSQAEAWMPQLRHMVLSRFSGHIPRAARRCVVHEPNGSEGADLLIPAMPSSRLLFLVRDGRDVVDSMVDGSRPGTWLDQAFGLGTERTGGDRLAYVIEQASRWSVRMNVVQRAYDQHPARLRYLVKYEDLLRNTQDEVSSIFRWLQVDEPRELSERIAALSFDAIPEKQKGPGRFNRAASPGLWRENLSEEEQQACDKVMAPTLTRFGYDRTTLTMEPEGL